MTARVEGFAGPLRSAVADLARQIDVDGSTFRCLLAPRLPGLGFTCDQGDLSHRAAWALAAQWLVGYASGSLSSEASFEDAEHWFLGPLSLPRISPARGGLGRTFGEVSPEVVFALLPYLLDPLAPATRLHVMKDYDLACDRVSRKTNGIYYTPADLADHMACSALFPAARSCLDPACGSGVYLRAAAARSALELALFGCDIDPLAAEMCSFVELATKLWQASGQPPVSPWAAWHAFRMRLATCDSLLLRPGTDLSEVGFRARIRQAQHTRARLAAGEPLPPPTDETASAFLGSLFPELADGADVLLTNPPYAALGMHPGKHEFSELYASFAQAPPTAGTNTYVPFVEDAWRLTHEHARASVVVPLSIAFGSGKQLRSLRSAIAKRPGRWKFSFFDRTPDALFGDDVKTRNAVLDYAADEAPAIETTELLRWTSRTRSAFLPSIAHVPIVERTIDEAIPKLGTAGQAGLYSKVRALTGCLGTSASAIRRLSFTAATERAGAPAVYVAATAYNWLSCARDLGQWKGEDSLSESPMTTFDFDDVDVADAAYAALASRLTLWLWRVEGDAFHVSTRFLANLPFDLRRLSDASLSCLSGTGKALWASVSARPVISINKGRRSVGFAPYHAESELGAVDAAVIDAFGLRPRPDLFDLAAWYHTLLIVDNAEAKRLALAPRTGGTPGA